MATARKKAAGAQGRAAEAGCKPAKYLLRLYVTGTTGRSVRAIQNVRRICEEHLKGLYDLEVVDIYKNLPLARGDQIIAAPTLIKRLPAPLRRLIGDMSDEQRVLVGLDLRPRRQIRVEVMAKRKPRGAPGRRTHASACAAGCRKPRTPSTPSATDTSRRSSCTRREGEQIYTLRSADQPYRLMVEQMREGALTLAPTARSSTATSASPS